MSEKSRMGQKNQNKQSFHNWNFKWRKLVTEQVYMEIPTIYYITKKGYIRYRKVVALVKEQLTKDVILNIQNTAII